MHNPQSYTETKHPNLVSDLALLQHYAKLKGKYVHECPDWDFMLIDETTTEWKMCLCYYHPPPHISLWIVLSAILWIVVIAAADYMFDLDLLPF